VNSCYISGIRCPEDPREAIKNLSLPVGSRPDGVFGAKYLHVGNICSKSIPEAASQRRVINDTLSRLLNDPDCKFLSFEVDKLPNIESLPETNIDTWSGTAAFTREV
jgi:hypothetical protein